MTDRLVNVLHVYKDYWPVLGGIENHVKALAEGTNRSRDVRASVLVTNPGRSTAVDEIGGVRVTKAGRIATLASTPLSPALIGALRRSTADGRDGAREDTPVREAAPR